MRKWDVVKWLGGEREELFPYLDQVVGPFDSLWFPDHVQYEQHKVVEGWNGLAIALARYLDKLCVHSLRHSWATHLLEESVNLRIIQLWLGHRSPTTTAISTHLTQKAEELASGVLDMLAAGM